MDPHYEVLQIIPSTLSCTQKKGISNNKFGDAVINQVLATISQCSAFMFKENHHAKVLRNDGNLALINCHRFVQSKKDKYEER